MNYAVLLLPLHIFMPYHIHIGDFRSKGVDKVLDKVFLVAELNAGVDSSRKKIYDTHDKY